MCRVENMFDTTKFWTKEVFVLHSMKDIECQDWHANPSSTIDDCCLRFDHDHNVLGACNGMGCLQDCLVGDEFEENWFWFWNPATRIMSKDSTCLHHSSYHYKLETVTIDLIVIFSYDLRMPAGLFKVSDLNNLLDSFIGYC